MQENKNSGNDVHKLNGSKSAAENIREANRKQKREELDAESREAEKAAEEERLKREEYAKKLAKERVELMQIKAGVIGSEDIPIEKEPERVYSTRDKIGNFFYHYKGYIIAGVLLAVLVGFFIYDMATKISPDVSVMYIATDPRIELITDKIEAALEPYCKDYNGDGHVFVSVSYMPAAVDTSEGSTGLYYAQSYQTKLVAEFQSADTIIVLTDDETNKSFGLDDGEVLGDLTQIYPDDKNATKFGYKLNATDFAKDIGYDKLSDKLIIGFRKPSESLMVDYKKFEKNYNNALELWDNYLKGNVVNTSAETKTN